MKLVTIQTYTYPHELAIVRGLLDSEGIETFVRDEMTAQVNPFYTNAIGGIKLQVAEEDAQKALEIMLQHGLIQGPETPGTDVWEPLRQIIKSLQKNILIVLLVIGLFVWWFYEMIF